jgi:ubiquinone/menaquinone biosynthesis C-methylase UbiE
MFKKKLPTLAFYNLIAGQYNDQLTESDKNVRIFVEKEFNRLVKGINILDFGGGTGLDLPWLLKSYKVFFLEPSENMRSQAKQSTANKNLFFVEKDIDFNLWNENNLPFSEKMDGILMNFAVLNCIGNINDLFRKTALVCNKQALLLALIIDEKKTKSHPIKNLLRSVVNAPKAIYNNHNGIGHKTYLHTSKQLRSASGEWFNLVSYAPIDSSDFALLILSKK